MMVESRDFKYSDYDCKWKELAGVLQTMKVPTLVLALNELTM